MSCSWLLVFYHGNRKVAGTMSISYMLTEQNKSLYAQRNTQEYMHTRRTSNLLDTGNCLYGPSQTLPLLASINTTLSQPLEPKSY